MCSPIGWIFPSALFSNKVCAPFKKLIDWLATVPQLVNGTLGLIGFGVVWTKLNPLFSISYLINKSAGSLCFSWLFALHDHWGFQIEKKNINIAWPLGINSIRAGDWQSIGTHIIEELGNFMSFDISETRHPRLSIIESLLDNLWFPHFLLIAW